MKKVTIKLIMISILIIALLIALLPITYAETRNNNPMLKGIKINGIDIQPTFEMFTTEYVVTVGDDVEQANIEGIPDDENATVEVIGDKNLKKGRNEFEIKVTAENGVATQSYFVYITKGDASKANANLKSLKVGEYTLAPDFNKDVINYAFEYPQSLEKLEIEAIPENENATIEIRGNENLKDVIHTIEIEVTAEDGQTVKTYYLTAKKADMEVEDPTGNENEQNITNPAEQADSNNLNERNYMPIIILGIILLIIVMIVGIKIYKGRKMKNEK